jgi:transcriptional regulator with XRE-family HTH domain
MKAEDSMNLKEARARRYWSERDLAEKPGVNVATIRELEAGRNIPQLKTARKVAEALGVDPSEVEGFRLAAEPRPRLTVCDAEIVVDLTLRSLGMKTKVGVW